LAKRAAQCARFIALDLIWCEKHRRVCAMFYVAYKFIHIAAVIIFLGNIITRVFWKAHGDRTRDPGLIAHTLEGIIRSDRWFTIPCIFVIWAGGFGAAISGGMPILRTGWIFWSVVLFTFSGIVFSMRVAPLQKELAALARAGNEFDWMRYRALSVRLEWWGSFALAAPVVAVVLMVFKPALPGL
jgi:uncharacterized membrane protein